MIYEIKAANMLSNFLWCLTSVQLKVIENQLLRNLTLLANHLKVSK
jgi:hypothetical protein